VRPYAPSLRPIPDPPRAVPRGRFTLDDYSYDDADLCHAHFGNCELPSLELA
jgi:hypothetical protein